MKHNKNFLFLLLLSTHFLTYGMLHKDLLQKQLIAATKNDDAEAVSQLLFLGACPNRLFQDTTATKIAICDGKINVLKKLLESKGDTEAAATQYRSSLFMSLATGSSEVLELLCRHKIQNDPNRIPLFQQIIKTNNPSIISLLQKYNYISGEDITLTILNITKNPHMEEAFLILKKEWEQDQLKKIIIKKNNYKAKRKHSEEEEEACLICCDTFTEKEPKNTHQQFTCRHYNLFHAACIQKWIHTPNYPFQNNLSCPSCRAHIIPKKITIKNTSSSSATNLTATNLTANDYDWTSTL